MESSSLRTPIDSAAMESSTSIGEDLVSTARITKISVDRPGFFSTPRGQTVRKILIVAAIIGTIAAVIGSLGIAAVIPVSMLTVYIMAGVGGAALLASIVASTVLYRKQRLQEKEVEKGVVLANSLLNEGPLAEGMNISSMKRLFPIMLELCPKEQQPRLRERFIQRFIERFIQLDEYLEERDFLKEVIGSIPFSHQFSAPLASKLIGENADENLVAIFREEIDDNSGVIPYVAKHLIETKIAPDLASISLSQREYKEAVDSRPTRGTIDHFEVIVKEMARGSVQAVDKMGDIIGRRIYGQSNQIDKMVPLIAIKYNGGKVNPFQELTGASVVSGQDMQHAKDKFSHICYKMLEHRFNRSNRESRQRIRMEGRLLHDFKMLMGLSSLQGEFTSLMAQHVVSNGLIPLSTAVIKERHTVDIHVPEDREDITITINTSCAVGCMNHLQLVVVGKIDASITFNLTQQRITATTITPIMDENHRVVINTDNNTEIN